MHRTTEQHGEAAGRNSAAAAPGAARQFAAGTAAALTLAVPVCLAQVAGAAAASGEGISTWSFATLWSKLAPQLAYGLQSALVLMAFALGLLIWQRRAQRHIAWLLALMPGWVVMVGLSPLSPSIARKVIAYFTSQRRPQAAQVLHEVSLTDRETEVLLRVAKGFTLPEIGVQLGLSRHTIADYVKQIYRKLNVSSRAEAALEAQRLGLFGRN